MFGSKKLWSTLFPPSSESRQGLRCCNEPLLHRKNQADSEENPKEEASGVDFQADQGSSSSPLFSRRFPRIMINGELLTEDQEVRDGIVNEFQKLLSEEQGWRADIEGLQFNQLSSRDANDLEEEVVEMFKEFFVHGSFAKSLNTTFLVLIPKKGGAEDLRDFRPISLLGGLYKLLAKVLANRLKKVLDRVVSVDQNAFVRGRQILDASLVANEVIDYWLQAEGERGEELAVSHLLFADDTLIFCEARREQLTNLSWILAWFEAASGLRINLAKSVLIPVGEVDELEELAAELGCRLGALPTVYLGLPLGALHKTSSSWDGVEERMRRRLAQWKRQYISKGGRITLIKSTLASIPIYLLSLIRIPKAVAKRIEKIQRDFLWGGGGRGCLEGKVHLINWKVVCSPKEEGGLGIRKIDLLNKALLGKWVWRYALIRIPKAVAKRIEKIQRDFLWRGGGGGGRGCLEGKVHLINWKVVCSPKEEGGLGIRKIDLLNKALLGKWVWRYAYEKDNLWKTVIGVKYGQEGCGWKTKEVCGPFGVGLWKEIMKEVDWCWENIVFKVGKGNRVLFWTDKWCGNEALAQSYPQLFTLAGHKNAKVCEVWDSSMGQGGWNLRLTRDFNDWEMEQIGDMLNLLKDFRTSLEEDLVRWKREGNGVFGAKGAYNILSGSSAGFSV
ncbi:putative ribonuclease H protein [Vitis vinifera]|uniref:Putative ribonuclease H protein n=1 Tax=Vitis vinifera TaxID=29760 RepID=A0A438IU19_VITVI|nr:putative ribonuclease H protein [Vitis vinifera]